MPCAEALIVKGDQAFLQSVIINLGVNARDAMPDGGELTLSCNRVASLPSKLGQDNQIVSNGYVEIHVSDTGTGMTPELKRRLFEPFFTTKPQGKGTGLGLASLYGTIKSHNGVIDVESEEGEGSTFTIYLPLAVTERTVSIVKDPAGIVSEKMEAVNFGGIAVLITLG